MRITQTTVTINAAFMQEIKEVNQELWDKLAEAIESANHPTMNPGRLVAALSELRDQVALHFALEEAYGYFEGPVNAAPRLSEQANMLRDEHQTLYSGVNALAEDVEDLHYRRKLPQFARILALRLQAFHDRLKEHEDRETDLLLQAYDDDIGVGD